jgi:hypothetical protein
MPLPIVFVSFCKDSFLANLGKCNRKMREGFGKPTDFCLKEAVATDSTAFLNATMARLQNTLCWLHAGGVDCAG